MTQEDIIALVIVCIITLGIIVGSIVMLTGRGAFLIAGYNTMSSEEKMQYDTKKLCKFIGKILLPIGILTPSIAVAGICKIDWIGYAYTGILFALVVFALIYCNTGNRFRSNERNKTKQ